MVTACACADEVRRLDALYTGPTRVADDDKRDALEEPLEAERAPFLEQVCDLEAETIIGLRVRAVTLAGRDKEALNPRGGWNEYLMAALVRDLVAGVQA